MLFKARRRAWPDEVVVIRAYGVPQEIVEELQGKAVRICDATCPFVKKDTMVWKKVQAEDAVFIAGDRNHPEVIGIMGRCIGSCEVFANAQELKELCEI